MSTVNPDTARFAAEMNSAAKRKRRVGIVVGALGILVLCAGGVMAYMKWSASTGDQKAVELATAAVSGKDANPFKAMETMKPAIDAGQITEDQARNAMRTMLEKRINTVVDGFFVLPVGKQRDEYLDVQIAEFEKLRAAWGGRSGPSTRPEPERTPEEQAEREQRRAQRETESQRRRDNTPPELQAKRAEFFAAFNARLVAQGKEPIRSPGGGRGFGGGGGPR